MQRLFSVEDSFSSPPLWISTRRATDLWLKNHRVLLKIRTFIARTEFAKERPAFLWKENTVIKSIVMVLLRVLWWFSYNPPGSHSLSFFYSFDAIENVFFLYFHKTGLRRRGGFQTLIRHPPPRECSLMIFLSGNYIF